MGNKFSLDSVRETMSVPLLGIIFEFLFKQKFKNNPDREFLRILGLDSFNL